MYVVAGVRGYGKGLAKLTPLSAYTHTLIHSHTHTLTSSPSQVGSLLDCFQDHWELQARVIVCMFSRISDLHMMDVLLRNLEGRTQQEVL
jgi:hypothetical protein